MVVLLRFTLTLAHFAAVVLAWMDKYPLIMRSISGPGLLDEDFLREYDNASYYFNWLVGIQVATFTFEFVGMVSGHAFLHPGFNTMAAVAHFCGAFFVVWCVLEAWAWQAMIALCIVFHAPVGLAECIFILDHIFFKSRMLRRIEILLPPSGK